MPQYLLRQIKTLQRLAIEELGTWIASQVEILAAMPVLQQPDKTSADSWLSQQIENIRKYLEHHVPKSQHNTIANEIIQNLKKMCRKYKLTVLGGITWTFEPSVWRLDSSVSHVKATNRMLEVFLTKNLTCLSLDFDVLPESCPKVLFSKSHLLSNLNKLHILTSEKDNMEEADLINLLKSLHDLKSLTVSTRYLCTDDTLKCLVDNCKLIEELNLKNNNMIDDRSVDMLTQLRNLRNLNVENTAVTDYGVEKILLTCYHIEEMETGVQTPLFRNSGDDKTGRALSRISRNNIDTTKRFKLKSYKNGANTTLDHVRLVVKTCPLIERVSFHNYDPSVGQGTLILGLRDVNNLRSLELDGYRFYKDNIREMLMNCGRNLIELTLIAISEIDLNALVCITGMCPNLQMLYMFSCYFVQDLDTYEDVSCVTDIKTLSLDSWSELTKPSDEQILFLLSYSPKLESICSGQEGLITDETISKVLERNPLTYLKKLRLNAGRLTISTINRILENCVNNPEILID